MIKVIIYKMQSLGIGFKIWKEEKNIISKIGKKYYNINRPKDNYYIKTNFRRNNKKRKKIINKTF